MDRWTQWLTSLNTETVLCEEFKFLIHRIKMGKLSVFILFCFYKALNLKHFRLAYIQCLRECLLHPSCVNN